MSTEDNKTHSNYKFVAHQGAECFDFLIDKLTTHEGIKYAGYALEHTKDGKPHYDGFICFKEPVRYHFLHKLLPGASVYAMRGSLHRNEWYTSAEAKMTTIGQRPMSQAEKGKKGAEYWEQQVELAKEDPDLCDAKLQITHGKSLDRIYERASKKRKLEDLTELTNEWFVGESGTGKSRTARQENPGAYIKQCNKWWNNYNNEEVVIIDDINPDHKFMANFIDQWADHYPFPAETKGGQITIRPKKIIITSRYEIEDIVSGSQYASWKRRFSVRRF